MYLYVMCICLLEVECKLHKGKGFLKNVLFTAAKSIPQKYVVTDV